MEAEPANVLELQKGFFLLSVFRLAGYSLNKGARFDEIDIFLAKTKTRNLMDL